MKKKPLNITGAILLIIGPSLGLSLNVYSLHRAFGRLAEPGVPASLDALSNSVRLCLLWSVAGIVVGIIGLIALIFGLILKQPVKQTGAAGLNG
jgi:uncharacterized membrane protein